MRPLNFDIQNQEKLARAATDSVLICELEGAAKFECQLSELRMRYHSHCIFNRQPSIVPDLKFWFDDKGIFHGTFTCNEHQQGYDHMVHGGIISAVIDASMAQCLMGHGIVGYTTELSIRYRKPLRINTAATLRTSITIVNFGLLYTMNCEIIQDRHLTVSATGKFFKVK